MNSIYKSLIFLLLSCLLVTGVFAADPTYEIDTTALGIDTLGANNYILYGDNLTLPINITYDGVSDACITRMVLTAAVTSGASNTPVTGIGYEYSLGNGVAATLKGSVADQPNVYQFTGTATHLTGTVPSAITLNITNLPASEEAYTVSLRIYAGDGTTDFAEQTKTLTGLKIYNFFIKETTDNTVTAPKWNLSNPLTVNTTILTSAKLPAGTYTSPWSFTTLTRGSGAYSLILTPANSTVTIWNQNTQAASSGISSTDGKLTFTLVDGDKGASSYLLQFTGKTLGDVSALYPAAGNNVNIADVNMMLHAYVSNNNPTYIAAASLIYADVNNDGSIDTEDATIVFKYISNKGDESV